MRQSMVEAKSYARGARLWTIKPFDFSARNKVLPFALN
jgi:hypothetical protein